MAASPKARVALSAKLTPAPPPPETGEAIRFRLADLARLERVPVGGALHLRAEVHEHPAKPGSASQVNLVAVFHKVSALHVGMEVPRPAGDHEQAAEDAEARRAARDARAVAQALRIGVTLRKNTPAQGGGYSATVEGIPATGCGDSPDEAHATLAALLGDFVKAHGKRIDDLEAELAKATKVEPVRVMAPAAPSTLTATQTMIGTSAEVTTEGIPPHARPTMPEVPNAPSIPPPPGLPRDGNVAMLERGDCPRCHGVGTVSPVDPSTIKAADGSTPYTAESGLGFRCSDCTTETVVAKVQPPAQG